VAGAFAGLQHAGAHLFGVFGLLLVQSGHGGEWAHADTEVHAVEERAGEPGEVAAAGVGWA
jgi:hypothetical protein